MGPLYLGKMGTFVNFRYINNLALRCPAWRSLNNNVINEAKNFTGFWFYFKLSNFSINLLSLEQSGTWASWGTPIWSADSSFTQISDTLESSARPARRDAQQGRVLKLGCCIVFSVQPRPGFVSVCVLCNVIVIVTASITALHRKLSDWLLAMWS